MQVNQIRRNSSESQKANIGSLWGNKRSCSRMIQGSSRKLEEILRSVGAICLSRLAILLTMRKVRLTVAKAAMRKMLTHFVDPGPGSFAKPIVLRHRTSFQAQTARAGTGLISGHEQIGR